MTQPAFERALGLDRIEGERLDLLVVGGGIVGAATAALAAERGLAVGLVERADFASGASSASSKLIHGGLRYLRMGDVGLVRQALGEAHALTTVVAPHLARPLPFLLPVYGEGPYGRPAIGAALWLYDRLARRPRSGRMLAPGQAASLIPSLRRDDLRAVGRYEDAQTNDGRLCLANLRSAAERGAIVLNYCELAALERATGGPAVATVLDRVGGATLRVEARAVVNAAGPWVDAVRRLESPRAGTSVRLSKGAHLVLAAPPEPWSAALTVPIDGSRVAFAVPWEGMLLLGTTDEPYEGDPGAVVATDADERQILAEAARALDTDVVRADAVRFRFAGLRVLPSGSARRETIVSVGPSGVVSVAGGKLTTYRRTAAAVLGALRGELGLHDVGPAERPLPGAASADAVAAEIARMRPELTAETAALLGRTYGSLAGEVLAYADDDPDALEPLAPGAPEIVAQAYYARDCEWAATADDVLRRRTTVSIRGRSTDDVRDRVERLLAPLSATEHRARS